MLNRKKTTIFLSFTCLYTVCRCLVCQQFDVWWSHLSRRMCYQCTQTYPRTPHHQNTYKKHTKYWKKKKKKIFMVVSEKTLWVQLTGWQKPETLWVSLCWGRIWARWKVFSEPPAVSVPFPGPPSFPYPPEEKNLWETLIDILVKMRY